MKEIRVYVVESLFAADALDMSDQDFMETAETQGTVYTLKGFEREFNQDFFGAFSSGNDYIRFIEVDSDQDIVQEKSSSTL